ncbi:MAG: ABC transporter permease [Chloroflexota bacterium]
MTEQALGTGHKSIRSPSDAADLLKRALSGDQPYMLYVMFVGLIVWFSIRSSVFLTTSNFANIGRQTALVSIIAVGMTFVIICAEIDLSVGSTLALGAMMASLAMQNWSDTWLVGALAGLATGACVGLVNGLLTTRLGIPSFLVTLATLSIASGLALIVTNTQPVIIDNQSFQNIFALDTVLGFPIQVIWTVVVAALGIILLHFSTFGRKVYATGGNTTAARYSGINTARVKTIAFVVTGMLAGFAGLILSGQSAAARPDFGTGLELDVIASVILGGTSLFGGRGTIIGTVLGSVTIGILNNGLVLIGVDPAVQQVIKGVIIIGAVAFGGGSGNILLRSLASRRQRAIGSSGAR